MRPAAPAGGTKCPSKFDGWNAGQFKQAGFRAVPGSVVRRSAHIAPGVVLMPSFVNVGAYVDPGTMVDTWATVGSCAQIGKNVHISGGTGIGGVLEPLQAGPVIIEDNCFIGARSEVAEGVIVGEEGAPYFPWASSSAPPPKSSTAPPEKRLSAVCRHSRTCSRARQLARQAAARRQSGTRVKLRRHRQTRRRQDARQSLHQRTPCAI